LKNKGLFLVFLLFCFEKNFYENKISSKKNL